MRNTKIKLMLGILFLFALGITISVAQPNREANLSKAVEHRIDNLSVILGEKADEGEDVKKAEDLLLVAIDLYEYGNYEEAMNKLDEVEKSLGLEPKRFDRNRQEDIGQRPFGQNNPMGDQFGMEMKELTADEKAKMKSEVLALIEELKTNVKKDNYEEADNLMREIHMRLFRLSGKRPQMGPGMGPGQGPGMGHGGQGGPGMGPGQGGPGGPGMGPNQGPWNNRDKNSNFKEKPRAKFNLDRIFERIKAEGPEAFDRATKIFQKIADKIEKKGRDVSEARKLYDKAVKQKAAGAFEAAVNTLRDAFESLIQTIKPGDMDGDGMNLEKVIFPDDTGNTQPKQKPKN